MREQAMLFGPEKTLVGVVTDPDRNTAGASAGGCGLVILNAGLVHRVGPNRLHVRLAREMAARGIVAMRFDFSGIGDSARRQDARSFAQAALDETRDCLDYLESSRGLSRFFLFGICSGADNALRCAREDERVRGAILVEPHAVPSYGYLLHQYRKRFFSPASWLRFLTGKSEAWLELLRLSSVKRSTGSTRVSQEFMAPSKQDFLGALRIMAERDQRALLVYCAGSPSHHFYRGGVRRKLSPLVEAGLVTETFVKGSDHIFTDPAARASLFDAAHEWIGRWIGESPSPVRSQTSSLTLDADFNTKTASP